jgi:hypothetical protein
MDMTIMEKFCIWFNGCLEGEIGCKELKTDGILW